MAPERADTESEWRYWDETRHKHGMVYSAIIAQCGYCEFRSMDADTREVGWENLRRHVEAKHAKEAGFLG